jgi:hypothetical protein
MNKNYVKCLQGINILQLTPARKTEIKNLDRGTPDLVIAQSSSSRKQTYVIKFNPSAYAVCLWFSDWAERNTLLSLFDDYNSNPIPTIRKSHELPLITFHVKCSCTLNCIAFSHYHLLSA